MPKWTHERVIAFLPFAVFVATFDRSVVAPMLVGMGQDFGVNLATITLSASAYYLAYGLAQPVWGIISDRLGRIATLRLALVLAGVFDLVSIIPMDIGYFIFARAVAGAMMAGVFPTAVIYIGDTIDDRRKRLPAIANLQTGVAMGLTFGTVLGGIGIATIGWQAFFVATALVCFGIAWYVRAIPNPKPGPDRLPVIASFATVFKNKWALLLFGLVFVEAAVLLGAFALVPAALETQGSSAILAGLVTGAYGISVLFTSIFVRKRAVNVPPHHFLFYGGTAATIGFILLAFRVSAVTVFISVIFQGMSWVLMHTTLQTWATSIAQEARATTVSLFAGFMFLGNGAGAYGASHLLEFDGATALFASAGFLMIGLTVIAVITQRRHFHLPDSIA
ncbi:MFS transporter [Actinomycetota bacterium]|nr:MFS transporter [Actinomycetota bacterium]MDB0039370.1 MFS transporter [Actinomycetota bacterium]MDC1474248.1 MFS transporter [Candidatus Nanopelagicales bacterium]